MQIMQLCHFFHTHFRWPLGKLLFPSLLLKCNRVLLWSSPSGMLCPLPVLLVSNGFHGLLSLTLLTTQLSLPIERLFASMDRVDHQKLLSTPSSTMPYADAAPASKNPIGSHQTWPSNNQAYRDDKFLFYFTCMKITYRVEYFNFI